MTRATSCVLVTALILTGCDRAPLAERPEAAPAPAATAAARAMHPLDPLTADEINTAISAARTDARLAAAVFPSITLQEPPKSDVLKWQRGQALRRRARLQRAIALQASMHASLGDVERPSDVT